MLHKYSRLYFICSNTCRNGNNVPNYKPRIYLMKIHCNILFDVWLIRFIDKIKYYGFHFIDLDF